MTSAAAASLLTVKGMSKNPSDDVAPAEISEPPNPADAEERSLQDPPHVDALLTVRRAAKRSGQVEYVENAFQVAVEGALGSAAARRWELQDDADALVERIAVSVYDLVKLVQENAFLAERVRDHLGAVPLTGLGLLFGGVSANDSELPLEFLRAATEESLLAVKQESFDAICAALASCRAAVESELAKRNVPGAEGYVWQRLVKQVNDRVKQHSRANGRPPSPETVASWAEDLATMARRGIFEVRTQVAADALKAESSEKNLTAALDVYRSIEKLEDPADWEALRKLWGMRTAGGKSSLPLLEYVASNEEAFHDATGLGELLRHQRELLPPEASVLRYATLGRTWRILLIRQPATEQRRWNTVLKLGAQLPALLGVSADDAGYRDAVTALADFASAAGLNDFVEAHRRYNERLLHARGEDT